MFARSATHGPKAGLRNLPLQNYNTSVEHASTATVPACFSCGLRRNLSGPSHSSEMYTRRACASQQARSIQREDPDELYLAQRSQRKSFLQQRTSTNTEKSTASSSSQLCHENNLGQLVARSGRLASLSRILLVGQPGSMFRNLANRKWPSSVGPVTLLVFLFGTLLAFVAAIRGALVQKVKACKCCKGFGVVRCRLCNGRGTVDWRAKFSYSEMCPLCAAKRFVVCPDCGGHYHRRIFNHAKDSKGTLEAFFPSSTEGNQTRSNPLD